APSLCGSRAAIVNSTSLSRHNTESSTSQPQRELDLLDFAGQPISAALKAAQICSLAEPQGDTPFVLDASGDQVQIEPLKRRR
ncbi:MAG: hypothetical protein ACLFTI_11875, partial [Anaerolineales bacterium]